MDRVATGKATGRSSHSISDDRSAESLPLGTSVVVPLYNEEENVVLLYNAISEALAESVPDYELLLVDDGSSDRTFERAEALVASDPRVRVIKFRRNYGQTAAMAAGIRHSRGDIIVTMDGDLQNDPADIPRLLAKIHEGYDLAVGWRRKRKDGRARVFISRIANRIMARIMGVAVKDSGCSLKAYRAPLIQNIPMYGEMHRFIPALCQMAGARMAELEVNHRPRRFGVSKYGFSRIYKVILDIVSIRALISFAFNPSTWYMWTVIWSFLLGALFLGLSAVRSGKEVIIEGGIGIVWLSAGLFFLAWGLVGRLFAAVDAEIGEFSALREVIFQQTRQAKEQ